MKIQTKTKIEKEYVVTFSKSELEFLTILLGCLSMSDRQNFYNEAEYKFSLSREDFHKINCNDGFYSDFLNVLEEE